MATRLETFTSWLVGMGDAFESGDAAGLSGLFAVGATFAPDPFAGVVRGRREILAWFSPVVAEWRGSTFAAQVLGAGDTYGVAHWRVASGDRARDGVWVVALDARGRCESLREWSSETRTMRPTSAID
jgi:SnoaL-like protein